MLLAIKLTPHTERHAGKSALAEVAARLGVTEIAARSRVVVPPLRDVFHPYSNHNPASKRQQNATGKGSGKQQFVAALAVEPVAEDLGSEK